MNEAAGRLCNAEVDWRDRCDRPGEDSRDLQALAGPTILSATLAYYQLTAYLRKGTLELSSRKQGNWTSLKGQCLQN